MPPQPKDPALRQRRNKTSTSATLSADPTLVAPELPDKEFGWHPATVKWWADIWASPMAPEFDDSDRHGLFMLADLWDQYWMTDEARAKSSLAAEIRLQRQCFGLTPIDRRRLQWTIEKTEDAQDRGKRRRSRPAAAPADPAADPRSVLRLA